MVDDGDGAGAEAAEALSDPRIRATANEGHGQVDARSTALALARGEVVCWLDDDDWWDDPGHLALLAQELRPGAICFRGGWVVFDSPAGARREVFDLDASAESLRVDNTILTSSIAYQALVHRRVGPLDAEMGSYWDWDLLLRMLDAGSQPLKLPGLAVCYSVHDENVSRDLASADRQEMFARLVAKHGLKTEMKNHLILHREAQAVDRLRS